MTDTRAELIKEMKEILTIRGHYQEDYFAGKFTVKGQKARFIQWPEFMAGLILEDRRRILEPLVKLEIEIDSTLIHGTYEQVQAHFNGLRREVIKNVLKLGGL